jgi:hypothetical protein
MRVMIDIVSPLFGHIGRIKKEQSTKYDCRNRNNDQLYNVPRPYQNEGEQYGADATAGAQAPVTIIVPFFYIGWNIGRHYGAHIQHQVSVMRQAKFAHIMSFHDPSEGIQCEHIECKMYEIRMDQPAGKKAVILMTHMDGRRPEYEVIKDLFVGESRNGDQTGKDNDTQGDREHSNFF